MSKEKFEQDILDVLKRYGYKTRIVDKVIIEIDKDQLPKVSIWYLELGDCKNKKEMKKNGKRR